MVTELCRLKTKEELKKDIQSKMVDLYQERQRLSVEYREKVKKNNKGNNMKNIVKKKKVSFKYVLFWVLGILGAILLGYFLFVGSMV